jgi:hypothetical protein
MERTIRIGRREFTRETLLAALSGVVVTVSGCGGGGGGGGNPTSPSVPNGQGLVQSNHIPGHSAVVTDAQLMAGNAVQLDIQGSANHPHTVVLSAEAIGAIRAGRAVAADSTTNASPTDPDHRHTVTFNGDVGEPSYY